MASSSTSKPRPTGVLDVDIVGAHQHSMYHRDALFQSATCGCFNCLEIFAVEAIDDWVDIEKGVGLTAMCPVCGIDSVIGSASGFPIEMWFLRAMQRHWMR